MAVEGGMKAGEVEEGSGEDERMGEEAGEEAAEEAAEEEEVYSRDWTNFDPVDYSY